MLLFFSKKRLLVWLFCLFSFLISIYGCTSDPTAPRLFFSSKGSAQPRELVRVTIYLTVGDTPFADKTEIKLSTDQEASFEETQKATEVTVSAINGRAAFNWYAPSAAGEFVVTAEAVINGTKVTNSLFVFVQKPATEVVVEKDAGNKEIAPEIGDKSENKPEVVGEKTVEQLSKQIQVLFTMQSQKKVLRADGEDETLLDFRLSIDETETEDKKKLFAEKVKDLLDNSLLKTPDPAKAVKIIITASEGILLNPLTKQVLQPISGTTDQFEIELLKGKLQAILRAGYKASTTKITASIDLFDLFGETSFFVEVVELGSIDFVSATPEVINVRFSGNEVSLVKFSLSDTQRKPFLSGKKVLFEIKNPVGDSTITKNEGFTDEQGEVSTQIKSGKVATTVIVTAKTGVKAPPSAQCPTSCKTDSQCQTCGFQCFEGQCSKVFEVSSQSIAIVGAKPSHRGMTFSCSRQNIGGLFRSVGSNVISKVTEPCTVVLADRFSNKVGRKTQVLFKIEAGSIDATSTTKEVLTGTDPSGEAGVATTFMRTQNPMPKDVPPLTVPNVRNCGNSACTIPAPGGYWLPYDCTGSISQTQYPNIPVEPSYTSSLGREHNPRDGVVTVIAYTTGEEAFTDTNGNGQYDQGEPFVDLGEPFVDSNDDGVWQPDESFVDAPCTAAQIGQNGCVTVGVGNGKRDGPNGKWDSETLIWKKTLVIWSGCQKDVPASLLPIQTFDLRSCQIKELRSGMDFFQPSNFKSGFRLGGVGNPDFFSLDVTVHDENLNQLTDISSITPSTSNLDIVYGGNMPPFIGSTFGFDLHQTNILQPNGELEDTFMIVPYTFWGTSPGRRYSIGLQKPTTLTETLPASFSVSIQSINNGGVKGCGANYVVTGSVSP